MSVELPEIKIGDKMRLITDKGIKKEKVKYFYFWEKEVEVDTYVEIVGIICSVTDDNSAIEVNGYVYYTDRESTPFRCLLSRDDIIEYIGGDDASMLLTRAGETVFSHNREIFRKRE